MSVDAQRQQRESTGRLRLCTAARADEIGSRQFLKAQTDLGVIIAQAVRPDTQNPHRPDSSTSGVLTWLSSIALFAV